jgi:hypothetical protein
VSLVKPKLSSLIQSQLPEFVREDHQTFVAFLKAYYDYLETTTPDIKTVRDIDTTLESFIKHFKNELALNLPDQLQTDTRFLIQHIKDQYLAKGSENSYKLLFKLLFNKPVTIDYPAKQMLRASDGKWNQDVSLMVKVTSGHPDQIVGRLVDIVTPSKIIRVQIDRRQYVEVEIERVTRISEDVYEFYIDRRYFGDIAVGDRLRYKTDNIYFSGDILATTSSLKILSPGEGFRVGQLYGVRNGQGVGTIMKITKTTSTGGIAAAEFIKFGTGYSTDFTSTIYADLGQSATGTGGSSLQIIGGNVSIAESLDGFTESGTINIANYWAGYGDGTYAGEVLREFGDTGTGAAITSPYAPAVIKISLGALAKYPGYYLNNDGFLDDAIYIQDSRYYQAYSYVIKIDERLDTYKSYVKTLLHPAGMAVFGEYDIRNEFDISLELESMIKILAVVEQDEVNISEAISQIFLTKSFEDSVATSGDYLPSKVLAKLLNGHLLNNNVTADNNQLILSDSISSRNMTKTLNGHLLNNGTTLDNNGVLLSDNIAARDFGKLLEDFPVMGDTITARDFGKSLADTSVVTEEMSRSITKYIDPAISGVDVATIEDSGGFMLINPYADAGWFLEQYVGTPINF